MRTLVHRTSLALRPLSSPEETFDPADWLEVSKQDLHAGPRKYWKIENDQVVEMDQSEKDIVDATDLTAAKKNFSTRQERRL